MASQRLCPLPSCQGHGEPQGSAMSPGSWPQLRALVGFSPWLVLEPLPFCDKDALEGHFEGLENSLRWVVFVGYGYSGDGGSERVVILSLLC